MRLGPGALGFVRHGALLFVATCLAALWERFAMQAPSSAFHVGVLPQPIADLKHGAFGLGVMLMTAAWLAPWIQPGKVLRGLLHSGSIITVIGLLYAALTGMKGVQFEDPRVDSLALLATRVVGEAILGSALIGMVVRVLRAPPSEVVL